VMIGGFWKVGSTLTNLECKQEIVDEVKSLKGK